MLSIKSGDDVRAKGFVLVTHPEFGMGVEFLQNNSEQSKQAERLVTVLRSKGETPELQVEPEGLDRGSASGQIPAATDVSKNKVSGPEDTLVELFRHKFEVPVESFMKQMRERRQAGESRSIAAKP